MSIQGLSYALGRCVSAVDFCWGVRKPHICGFSKVYLSWEFSASPKGNAQLAWPRLASYCDGDQIKFVPNTLISRALTLKCSEGLRSEQRNSSGWDVKWSMHKKGRASGTQYTLTSHFLSGIDFPREEDSKTALQTMDRKSEEDGFGDQSTEVAMLRDLEAALGSPFESGPQAPAPKPLIIVISGPSGVGKDAVIKRLQEVRKGIHFVVTATTRAKRPGEVDGKDYYFIHKEEFSSMIEKNELLEYALVYGDYKGIPKQQPAEFLDDQCSDKCYNTVHLDLTTDSLTKLLDTQCAYVMPAIILLQSSPATGNLQSLLALIFIYADFSAVAYNPVLFVSVMGTCENASHAWKATNFIYSSPN